jgi:hypothetical protein
MDACICTDTRQAGKQGSERTREGRRQVGRLVSQECAANTNLQAFASFLNIPTASIKIEINLKFTNVSIISTMFRLFVVCAALLCASAFNMGRIPARSSRSALKMQFDDQPGVLPPTGYWDPLG